jgi:quercetin dioxygenase-like cupin family protein
MDDRDLNRLLNEWKAPDAPPDLRPRRTRRSRLEWLVTGRIAVPVPAGLLGLALVTSLLVTVWLDSATRAPGFILPAETLDSMPLLDPPETSSRGELARHALTGDFEGFEAVLSEMTIPAGVSLPEHSHPGFVLGYILDGLTRSGVNYEPDEIIQPGGTFFEPPGAVHSTFGSASADAVSRVLLFMVVPADPQLASAEAPPPAVQDRGSPVRGDSELPDLGRP